MPVLGEGLAREVGRRYAAPVQMMQLNHGIFDDASISVIASETVREICRLAGRSADVRRLRPNIVVRSTCAVPSRRIDGWAGCSLSAKGTMHPPSPSRRRSLCDGELRSRQVSPAPEVLKAVVRAHQNNAGIYGTVTRIGRLAVGQTIRLHAITA
jgi:hypothetical protein